jgi:radical SAM protein with 4Fe4S-binding SPASM domain
MKTQKILVWEYTLKCNSKCIHCGSDAGKPRPNELTSSEALNVVDQAHELGFKKIILSGGEPTLRKDWTRTAERINDYGMKFGIISNGLAWNGQTIENILSTKPFAVGFSVDGEPKLHNYLRGAKGSHEKVFESIMELKRKNQPVCAVTSVSKKNFDELKDIRYRLNDHNVDAWQIQLTSPMGRMDKHLILDPKEYYQLAEFIIDTRGLLPYMNVQAGDCVGYYGSLENELRDGKWNGCSAGIYTIGLDSDGGVRGCLSIRIPEAVEGNIRKQSLKEIWEDPNNFSYNRKFNVKNLKGECRGCEHGAQCRGGCQCSSTAFYGEFNKAPLCNYRYEGGIKNGKEK